ncbi:MAG: lipopolysaccharide transport periplasmic protein LptA [Gammaproteobacteria bacterium]|nr:lipopolysaccharide transport periplasmic protein LptA [Gammaproteobacteria bacterium]
MLNPSFKELVHSLRLWLALTLWLCLTIGSTAHAKKSDLTQPIDVSADRSEYDEVRGVQTLLGNVEITQGTMKIQAQRIDIFLADNKLSKIEGSGSPIRFEQENEAGELVVGQANRISYDAIGSVLILEGNATLSQPKQELTSERIEFNALTQKVSAEGGADSRVNIRIQPPSGN